MKTIHLQMIYLLNMVIFHGYVSLPKGMQLLNAHFYGPQNEIIVYHNPIIPSSNSMQGVPLNHPSKKYHYKPTISGLSIRKWLVYNGKSHYYDVPLKWISNEINQPFWGSAISGNPCIVVTMKPYKSWDTLVGQPQLPTPGS